MNLSDIVPHLLHSFRSEADLVKAIEEVSLKFTKERDSIGDYLNDPRLVSAYTAFYLLTNLPKLRGILKWLPADWIREAAQCDFVDLGAGPGTFSFAWAQENFGQSFYQIEQSKLMREQARRLWDAFQTKPLLQDTRWNWPSDRKKFLLFGHSANEMGAKAALNYIQAINPEHILFIEPGTKSFFPLMLELRAALIGEGFEVLYPCPKNDACPMRGSDDWCHQFLQVRQEDEVERISQKVRLDRKLLPLTVQAFSRTFQVQNPQERVVRVFDETKFSFEWEVCASNKLEKYQVMKRDLSKSQTKKVGSIMAGDHVETVLVKALESSRRVQLRED